MALPDASKTTLSRIKFLTLTVPIAWPTLRKKAAAQHVPGKEMAKTIVLKTDSQFAMVVPAVMKINMKTLREEVPFVHVELASEKEFA
jgi:Ala-tRNA(Pro) deacylase